MSAFSFIFCNLVLRHDFSISKNFQSMSPKYEPVSKVEFLHSIRPKSHPTIMHCETLDLKRRAFCTFAASSLFYPSCISAAIWTSDDAASRLEGSNLVEPQFFSLGKEDIEYPDWLEGSWNVVSIMTNFSLPLGNRFLGSSNPEANDASAREAASQIGKPVAYSLRFERLGGRVAEDRLFNTQQRLDAFAGRPVVRRVEAVETDRGGDTKRLNTLTYFRGGLVGKTISLVRTWRLQGSNAAGAPIFTADELTRQLYARRCDQAVESRICPPPIVTDQEIISQYRLLPDGSVDGNVRLASYLNPNDLLYFAAERRAVTLSDYSLRLTRQLPQT